MYHVDLTPDQYRDLQTARANVEDATAILEAVKRYRDDEEKKK